MNALIDQAIQVSVVLLAALALASWMRRASAAFRHCVLAAAVLAALALPFARFLVPEWSLLPSRASIDATAAASAPAAATLTVPAPARAPRVSRVPAARPAHARLPVVALWAVGAGLNLLVLVAGIGRLAWHGRRGRELLKGPWCASAERVARELGIRRRVTILETQSSRILGACGWRKPRLLLPRGAGDWPGADVDIVLRHELAHVARGDWTFQLAAEVMRALHWFNPLAWLVSARLRLASERACDDEVLNTGVRGEHYASRLLHLAAVAGHGRWGAPYPAPGMARRSSLERRVTAMLDPALIRTAVSRRSRLVIAVITLAIALPLAGFAVLAQSGGISGAVLDPSGKNVANTRIVLTNVHTKARQEIKSNAQGRFEFAGLAPGEYEMEAALPGFKTLRGLVTVGAAGVTRDIKLELGSLQETITVSAAPREVTPRKPRAAAPPELPPCVPTAMGGDIRPPLKLKDVKPDYAEALRSAKVSGLVVVNAIISGDGSVRDLRVVETPHVDLGRSVVKAVSEWRFTPTLLNCQPTDVKMKVDVKFVLD